MRQYHPFAVTTRTGVFASYTRTRKADETASYLWRVVFWISLVAGRMWNQFQTDVVIVSMCRSHGIDIRWERATGVRAASYSPCSSLTVKHVSTTSIRSLWADGVALQNTAGQGGGFFLGGDRNADIPNEIDLRLQRET